MLYRWSGGRFAGPAQSGKSTRCSCRSRGWTRYRAYSHAADHGCVRGKSAAFVRTAAAPGSVIHTDGWLGYLSLVSNGYVHDITIVKGNKKTASDLLPRVHRVISLLKRWLMGTHQGAVSHKHLDYYLDEFTFRFNRRRSRSRGKLFFRLVQQAVAADPVPLDQILHPSSMESTKSDAVGST